MRLSPNIGNNADSHASATVFVSSPILTKKRKSLMRGIANSLWHYERRRRGMLIHRNRRRQFHWRTNQRALVDQVVTSTKINSLVALADRTVRRYIAKRGYRRPEDRLRAALLGSGVIMPLSCCERLPSLPQPLLMAFQVAYGWLIQYRCDASPFTIVN